MKYCIFLSVGVNVGIAILYFPITILSEKTPAITSVEALGLWLLAHIIYGIVLGIGLGLLRLYKTENSVYINFLEFFTILES